MYKKIAFLIVFICLLSIAAQAKPTLYHVGEAKAVDSVLKVKVGDIAPDFELPSITGEKVRLSQYLGKQNVVISFVPAAWTPICSDQWPGYNIAQPLFEDHNTVLLGVTVDNTPSQYAWSEAMNTITFPVLSDFWPHGQVADSYGVLRSDGMSERALFIVDMRGVIRYIDVHDINTRPDLGELIHELEKLKE